MSCGSAMIGGRANRHKTGAVEHGGNDLQLQGELLLTLDAQRIDLLAGAKGIPGGVVCTLG